MSEYEPALMSEYGPEPKPTREWIDACREDIGLAIDAIEDWATISREYFYDFCRSEQWTKVPVADFIEYENLTDAIVLWGDSMIKSIDPTPIINYTRKIIQYYHTHRPEQSSVDTLGELLNWDVQNTYLRLIRATRVLLVEQEPPRPDGPDPEREGVFWWQGQRHRIAKQAWRLASVCWEAEEMPFEDLRGKVFEGEASPTTIRSAVSRLNSEMSFNKIAVEWSTSQECVSREVF